MVYIIRTIRGLHIHGIKGAGATQPVSPPPPPPTSRAFFRPTPRCTGLPARVAVAYIYIYMNYGCVCLYIYSRRSEYYRRPRRRWPCSACSCSCCCSCSLRRCGGLLIPALGILSSLLLQLYLNRIFLAVYL